MHLGNNIRDKNLDLDRYRLHNNFSSLLPSWASQLLGYFIHILKKEFSVSYIEKSKVYWIRVSLNNCSTDATDWFFWETVHN